MDSQTAQPEHFAGGAEAGTDVGGRRYSLCGEQFGGDLGALGAEVAGEAAQMAEVVCVVGRYVGAASVACLDQAVIGEQLEGLTQGHDADAELARELVLGGQRAARGPLAIGDAVTQVAVDA